MAAIKVVAGGKNVSSLTNTGLRVLIYTVMGHVPKKTKLH
jgi:hypothetical protein